MGCKMSKRTGRKAKNTKSTDNPTTTSVAESEDMVMLLDIGEIQGMKRAQLQKLCKQFGLKASGKNTELIERLQECISKRDVGVLDSNNNTTNATEEQPQPSTSFLIADDHITELNNKTFEIIDSQIPKDHHVHVSSEDGVDSKISCTDLGTNEENDSAVPDSSTDINVQEQTDSENESSSRRALEELNPEDPTGIKANLNKARVNACTKWCVVEGLLKQEIKVMWKRIHLIGGRPMVSNSFGKRVPFVLEPCGITTPENYEDNFICGSCVRDNEAALRWNSNSRSVHSSVAPQEVDSSELGVSCSTPMSSTHTLLTSFSRVGSVKRKRSEDTNSSVVNSSTDSDQMEKKRRKDQAVVRSGSSTPASPQVRRARGEQLILPRNLQRPWRPKKATKAAQSLVKEDTDFAKRVEEIIKNTQPGSEEEMQMIMSSKSNKIRRSPTRDGQQ